MRKKNEQLPGYARHHIGSARFSVIARATAAAVAMLPFLSLESSSAR